MASMSEKTERRWRVLIAILIYNGAWGVLVFVAFLAGHDVSKLDVISGALFGSSVLGIVGNWMSKPTGDDQ
jgi:lipopolysaccharide export LptBFGC system permease protein LptF